MYHRLETLYTVKICTQPILMTSLPPPVLIADFYKCTDDWVPQTLWHETTMQHTKMCGPLNLTHILILLRWLGGSCPIITHKKLTHLSVEVVLCALLFHSVKTSCFFLHLWQPGSCTIINETISSLHLQM